MLFEHYDGRNRGAVDQHLYCLYLFTLNDQQYVGQTNDTYRRFISHRSSSSGCIYIRDAIKSYGWENTKVDILLVDLTLEEANRLETHYIDILGTLAPGGYNLTRGGDNREFSEDSKKKMSKTRKAKCEDPGFIEAMSENAKKVWEKPGYKEAKVEQMNDYWDTPGMRAAQGVKSKERWDDNPEARKAQGVRSKEVWETPGHKEKQRDAKKYMRKFTDEELIQMNDEFRGSNDKLRLHFGVSNAVIIKHKKRLGLENKYADYRRKFTDDELLIIDEEFKGDVKKLSAYFDVVECVIYKHRKRLGLSGKCYNN